MQGAAAARMPCPGGLVGGCRRAGIALSLLWLCCWPVAGPDPAPCASAAARQAELPSYLRSLLPGARAPQQQRRQPQAWQQQEEEEHLVSMDWQHGDDHDAAGSQPGRQARAPAAAPAALQEQPEQGWPGLPAPQLQLPQQAQAPLVVDTSGLWPGESAALVADGTTCQPAGAGPAAAGAALQHQRHQPGPGFASRQQHALAELEGLDLEDFDDVVMVWEDGQQGQQQQQQQQQQGQQQGSARGKAGDGVLQEPQQHRGAAAPAAAPAAPAPPPAAAEQPGAAAAEQQQQLPRLKRPVFARSARLELPSGSPEPGEQPPEGAHIASAGGAEAGAAGASQDAQQQAPEEAAAAAPAPQKRAAPALGKRHAKYRQLAEALQQQARQEEALAAQAAEVSCTRAPAGAALAAKSSLPDCSLAALCWCCWCPSRVPRPPCHPTGCAAPWPWASAGPGGSRAGRGASCRASSSSSAGSGCQEGHPQAGQVQARGRAAAAQEQRRGRHPAGHPAARPPATAPGAGSPGCRRRRPG